MKSTYGRLMLDIDGRSLSIEDKKLISNKHVGGLIFFSKNFESFQQLSNLVKEVREIKENILIAVDQEGGRVQRFYNEFTNIPSMQEIGRFAKDHSFHRGKAWERILYHQGPARRGRRRPSSTCGEPDEVRRDQGGLGSPPVRLGENSLLFGLGNLPDW